jgi:hypothetical protein
LFMQCKSGLRKEVNEVMNELHNKWKTKYGLPWNHDVRLYMCPVRIDSYKLPSRN